MKYAAQGRLCLGLLASVELVDGVKEGKRCT